MEQIEQLQSCTDSRAGASTSKATRPQWQPPRWMINCVMPCSPASGISSEYRRCAAAPANVAAGAREPIG